MGRILSFFGRVLGGAEIGVGGCDATPQAVGGASVSLPASPGTLRIAGDGPWLPASPAIDPRLSHYELCVLRGMLQPYLNGPHWFSLSTIAAKLEAAAEHVAPRPLDVTKVPGIDLANCTDGEFRQQVQHWEHDLRLAQQATMPLTLAEERGEGFERVGPAGATVAELRLADGLPVHMDEDRYE